MNSGPFKSWSKCVGWLLLLLVCAANALTACAGGDSNAGSAGAAGDTSVAGDTGAAGADSMAEAGAAPVAPGDLACGTNQDCKGDKPVCDPIKGCVACIYDWDCPAGDRCDQNQCFVKQPCAGSSECKDSTRPLCDPVEKVCVACRLDSDCGHGQRCDASRCEQIEACTNSRDCSDGKVCDRAASTCVACVADGDCGSGNACFANRCVPTCTSDKACLGIGLLCDPDAGRCVECLSKADCPTDYFCSASGVCREEVCQPGHSRCDDAHTLQQCSDDGDRYVGSSCAGNTTCSEESERATCAAWLCTPGGTLCSTDASSAVTCDDTGLVVASTEPCGTGQLCVSGACTDVVCTPSQGSCDGQDLYRCSSDGTQKTKVQTCLSSYKCNADSVTCDPPKCVANQPLCSGGLLTTCAVDGSGPVAGGAACADGQACFVSQCLPVVCSGTYQCDADGQLYRCQNQGTSRTALSLCSSPGLCDATAGKCNTPKCTPGAFACNGNVATRCKADGSDYESGGTDCSAQNLVCDGGGCLPTSCTPNAYFCQSGNVEHCSASGATYTLNDTCALSEFCADGSQFCQLDKCTAGSAVCNGNLVTTCAADGSGPVAGGTDCAATSQICVAGACKAVVCTPGAFSCQGEAVYQCASNGTGTTLYTTCLSTQFCDGTSEPAACVADICGAGKLGCNAEVIATCAANGGSWTNPGTNCAASSQVCALGGTCAAQELSVQGTATYLLSYSNASALAGFRALTTRKLTQVEVYASVGGLQKFTWVVYQKRSGGAQYDLVYQKVTAQTAPTAGFVSSGALSYTFSAGKTYLIGVHVAGLANYYYNTSPFLSGSFVASPFGGVYTDGTQPSATISPPSGYAVNLRLTTTLP